MALTLAVSAAEKGDFGYFDYLRTDAAETNGAVLSRETTGSVVRVVVAEGGDYGGDDAAAAKGGEEGGGGAAPPSNEKSAYTLIHIANLSVLSVGGRPYRPGIDATAAILLAAHHFNNGAGSIAPSAREAVVDGGCGVRLTVETFDTMFSPLESSRILANEILPRFSAAVSAALPNRDPPPTAILSGERTDSTEAMSTLAGVQGLPVISFGASGDDLDDKGRYPLFGRTFPSSSLRSFVSIRYMTEVLGATHLAVLYLSDSYGRSERNSLGRFASEAGVVLKSVPLTYGGDAAEIERGVRALRATGFRYFYLSINVVDYVRIMAEAFRQGIAGPGSGILWILPQGLSEVGTDNFWEAAGIGPDQPAAQATDGVAVLVLYFVDDVSNEKRRGYDAFNKAWLGEMQTKKTREYFSSKLPIGYNASEFAFSDHTPIAFSFTSYDATMALGLAACRLTRDRERNSDEVGFNGPDLFQSFLQTGFDGASGRVEFDHVTGSRDYQALTYSVTNLVLRKPYHGSTDSATASFDTRRTAVFENSKWTTFEDTPFLYADGTTTPPPDLPPINLDLNLIPTWMLVLGGVVCGLILFISIFWAVWTYKNRATNLQSSQPVFLFLLALGTFVMGTAIIPLSLQEPASQEMLDASCMAFPWLFSMGFVIVFTSLFSSLMSLNKTSQPTPSSQVQVKAKEVILPFALSMSNLVVLVSWTMIAPLKWNRHFTDSIDIYGRSVASFAECSSSDSDEIVFIILIVAINVAAVVYANIEAYKARKITSKLNDSRSVVKIMAIMFQEFCIGAPILVAVQDFPPSRYFGHLMLVAVTCLAILLLVFPPKWRSVIQWRAEQVLEEKKKQARSEFAELNKKLAEVPAWVNSSNVLWDCAQFPLTDTAPAEEGSHETIRNHFVDVRSDEGSDGRHHRRVCRSFTRSLEGGCNRDHKREITKLSRRLNYVRVENLVLRGKNDELKLEIEELEQITTIDEIVE